MGDQPAPRTLTTRMLTTNMLTLRTRVFKLRRPGVLHHLRRPILLPVVSGQTVGGVTASRPRLVYAALHHHEVRALYQQLWCARTHTASGSKAARTGLTRG